MSVVAVFMTQHKISINKNTLNMTGSFKGEGSREDEGHLFIL